MTKPVRASGEAASPDPPTAPPSDPPAPDAGYTDRLVRLAAASGIDRVGVCRAEPFTTTEQALVERKAEGLHGGMKFTYRRPEVAADPTRSLPDARSLIVGAVSYNRHVPDAPDGPSARVARYVWEPYYDRLRASFRVVADQLKADGWRARILVDDNALVDREAAYRAGLGWYGKNANLLLPGEGSWFVLGSLLTDAPLVAAASPVPDGCGSCTRCISGCPTEAIVRPGVVDARRCLAWLVQAPGVFPVDYRAALGDRLYGCDDCQEVCPPNRRQIAELDADAAAAWVPVVDVLNLTDDQLLERFGAWYIPRRQPRFLRRNALVVLGNTGRGDDVAVGAALAAHLAHGDGMVRAHAVWAAKRLGRTDLLADVEPDADGLVEAELALAVDAR